VFSVSAFLTFLPQSEFAPALLFQMKLYRGVLGFALTLGIRHAIQALHSAGLATQTVLALAVAGMAGPIWLWLYASGVSAIWNVTAPALRGGFIRASLDYSFVLALWSALYMAARIWQDRERAERAAMAAESRARDAELEMLRYQLNPHFVFNALNSIRALIPEAALDARRLVTEFSELLRYTLREAPLAPIRVRDEVNAARRYVAVERIRFEDALEVRWQIDPRAENHCIPGFTLQPLVENALRHGRAAGNPVVLIDVRAWVERDALTIEVANNGALRHTAPGTGVALTNLRQRLNHHFPDRATLTLTEHEGWVRATIHIATPGVPCAP